MLVYSPTRRIITKSIHPQARSSKSVTSGGGNPCSCPAKTNNVGFAVTIDISHHPGMLVNAPTASVITKSIHPQARFSKSVTGGSGNPCSCPAKTNNVSFAVTIDISHHPGMLVSTPTASVITKSIHPQARSSKSVTSGGGNPCSCPAKTNNVGFAVTIDISHHPGMLVNAPTASVITKSIHPQAWLTKFPYFSCGTDKVGF